MYEIFEAIINFFFWSVFWLLPRLFVLFIILLLGFSIATIISDFAIRFGIW